MSGYIALSSPMLHFFTLWLFLACGLGGEMDAFLDLLNGVLDAAMMLLALTILVALFAVVVLYVIDVTQNSKAIRKDYPVIGRLRYVFEHLGVFLRQYFFAVDREKVQLIAHSCGLLDPQALSWQHAFVINDQGQPSPLNTVLSP